MATALRCQHPQVHKQARALGKLGCPKLLPSCSARRAPGTWRRCQPPLCRQEKNKKPLLLPCRRLLLLPLPALLLLLLSRGGRWLSSSCPPPAVKFIPLFG